MRSRLGIGSVLLAGVLGVLAPARAEPAGYFEPDAVLIRLTEHDLGRILEESVLTHGGPVFRGTRDRVSDSVSDLRYYADLTLPELRLGDDGRISLSFEIREANLSIGRFERRIAWRRTSCEDAAVFLDAARPLDVTVALRFLIEDGSLRLAPEAVDSTVRKGDFRFVKPSHCRNKILPTWLLWPIGKHYLRRHLGRLDSALLERVERSADRLNAATGRFGLQLHVDLPGDKGETRDLYLYPRQVRTDPDALLVGLAASSTEGEATAADGLLPPQNGFPSGSYIAVSESFINAALELRFTGIGGKTQTPSGTFERILNSRALTTLAPGLRDRDDADVSVSVHFESAPRVSLRELSRDEAAADPVVDPGLFTHRDRRAVIGVNVGGIEIQLRDNGEEPDRLLGSLRVDSGRIGLLPYVNMLGGLSFELVENDWRLSSTGVEFDRPLFAAMLQELVFAEVFETTYRPLATEALRVGNAEFLLGDVSRAGDYLVVGLVESAGVPESGAGELNAHANR